MPFISGYEDAYYSMTWEGPKGYPEQGNSGRCYFTGILGMLRFFGEKDMLFCDGLSGDGFSFRWCPIWGAPAFNGGKGAFHEIWEYTPKALGFKGHWEEDPVGGWEEAWKKLCTLIDQNIPVQVGLHYSRLLPYGANSSPRLAFQHRTMGPTGFGHHVVVTGYDKSQETVTIYEPNDVLPYCRYDVPIAVFKLAWEEAAQRGPDGRYEAWPGHHPWGGEWSLHDGYGPYLMVWIEPGRQPDWDIRAAISHSYRRNMKILSGEYPKPYSLFGSQWQIPHFETGARGMLECARAIKDGRLTDPVAPDGKPRPLFVRGNIANHGVLGRRGASGYLARVARELDASGLPFTGVETASMHMKQSSDLFRTLRYTEDLMQASGILESIARHELDALAAMQDGFPSVTELCNPAQDIPVRLQA